MCYWLKVSSIEVKALGFLLAHNVWLITFRWFRYPFLNSDFLFVFYYLLVCISKYEIYYNTTLPFVVGHNYQMQQHGQTEESVGKGACSIQTAVRWVYWTPTGGASIVCAARLARTHIIKFELNSWVSPLLDTNISCVAAINVCFRFVSFYFAFHSFLFSFSFFPHFNGKLYTQNIFALNDSVFVKMTSSARPRQRQHERVGTRAR